MVTERMIAEGLRGLGLGPSSSAIVHSSLRSFGNVQGGAPAVCRALISVCGTLLLPAGTWDITGVPAPPGLVRPHNAVGTAVGWAEFDTALARATPYTADLPIDRELGQIPEAMRLGFAYRRSAHPLMSYLAVGRYADALIGAQRLDWPLGPIEELAAQGGDVLLLGVSHTANRRSTWPSSAWPLALLSLCQVRAWRLDESPNIPGRATASTTSSVSWRA